MDLDAAADAWCGYPLSETFIVGFYNGHFIQVSSSCASVTIVNQEHDMVVMVRSHRTET